MNHTIVGDWGTSNLRLNLINSGKVLETKNGLGIKLVQDRAKEYLYSLCEEWINKFQITEAYLCGMGGSRMGIIETEYLEAPLKNADYFQNFAPFVINNVIFKQSYGVKCHNFGNSPDVMRGEEMQIFGALSALKNPTGLLILPGTHSKWVKVESGSIKAFQTYPSGELFDLLQNHSTLGSKGANFDEGGFIDGVEQQIRHNGVLGNIFAARSSQLISGKSADWSKGYISGIIIAAEINENLELARQYEKITLIGAKKLCENYSIALKKIGIKYEILDGDECVIQGLLQFSNYGK